MSRSVPKLFLLDVDGVMTDGTFYYSTEGKVLKRFGADDHDALLLVKPHLEIRFITGDRKGFDISQKRIAQDMKMPLNLVSTIHRVEWIEERYDLNDVIYMGDGIFDPLVFARVGYSIAPANSLPSTRDRADHVTDSSGGHRAVAEACVHILDRFFEPFKIAAPPKKFTSSGEWGI